MDRTYEAALRALATHMIEDPQEIGSVLNVMWVLRALERVGDHATNIAEHVIYLVKGTDIRHLSTALVKNGKMQHLKLPFSWPLLGWPDLRMIYPSRTACHVVASPYQQGHQCLDC